MTIDPSILGFSSDRLHSVDRFLHESYIAPGKLPFALTLVARKGQLAHLGFSGLMDEERGKAVAADSIFRIYSMTKPLTTVAFMMLVEEGKVGLDDRVDSLIPAWRELGVYAGGIIDSFRTTRPNRPMLIVDLLRHTSGLTYGFQHRTNVDAAYRQLKIGEVETAGTLETMVAGLATLPLEFSPGAQWNYSVSTDVLGYLIGKIEGRPFEEVLKRRLIDPLGMVDTDFYVPKAKHDRLAACYAINAEGRRVLQDDPAASAYLEPPAFVSGGGGLVSTAGDYLKFCTMLLNRGEANGRRYLSPKTLALMTCNHLPGGKDLTELSLSLFSEATYAGVGFGLGFSVTLDPAKTLLPGSAGEYAWGGAASTAFWIDPVEQLIVIFMTQLLPSGQYPIRRQLRTLIYSAITESFG